MNDYLFEDYWELFNPDAEFANRRSATQRAWEQCRTDRQQAIIEWLKAGKPKCTRNPYFFIQDFRCPRQQVLSYNDYYSRYHTTDERDGWKRKFIAEEQRTIYVKH